MLRVRAIPEPKGATMTALLAQSGEQTGGLTGLLFPLLLMGGVFYFLLIRPQRTRQRQQQALLAALQVGDEVMTAGGIFGTITEIDEDNDTVTVEISPGTRIRMLRRAIAQRMVEDDLGEPSDGGAGSRP
jgi:preprotein translocase subunit YajC